MERGGGAARSVAISSFVATQKFYLSPEFPTLTGILVSQFRSSATINFCLYSKFWSVISKARRRSRVYCGLVVVGGVGNPWVGKPFEEPLLAEVTNHTSACSYMAGWPVTFAD